MNSTSNSNIDDLEETIVKRRKVKICRLGHMLYIFIPKFVEKHLKEKNISIGDIAVWEIESIDNNKIVCRILFTKKHNHK
ncbi:MAG: hypothetical protein QW456_09380, partial [Ignisphaera sp.]